MFSPDSSDTNIVITFSPSFNFSFPVISTLSFSVIGVAVMSNFSLSSDIFAVYSYMSYLNSGLNVIPSILNCDSPV